MDMMEAHFGKDVELVLHDLEADYEKTIIDIRNGEVTGRTVGDGGDNLGLEVVRGTVKNGSKYNYINYTDDGKVLKSSTLFLRDESGRPVYALAINEDVTQMWQFEKYLREKNQSGRESDVIVRDVNKLLEDSIKDAQLMIGKSYASSAHHTGEKWPPLYNYVCQSDDGGRTWRLLPTPASDCGDESKLAELADGSWLISIRNPDRGYRRYAISHDRGKTWSEAAEWRDLPDPACNGDLLRYSLQEEGATRNRLLHSIPADTAQRRNVSVALSYDEGRTWPVRKSVWEGYSGYSALTRLADGAIGLLSEVADGENGYKICFTRLTIGWLTDGADDGR